ncbi:MAG: hypothetical protein AAF512_09750, partial [Pseudomonadota bacterium]
MKFIQMLAALSAVLFINVSWAEAVKTTAAPETKSCVHLLRVDRTKVVDDKTILFYMRNGNIWKNSLPHKCSGLGFEKSFAYKTSMHQLCNVDTITVLRLPHGSGPTCGLGKFEAYEEPKDAEKS